MIISLTRIVFAHRAKQSNTTCARGELVSLQVQTMRSFFFYNKSEMSSFVAAVVFDDEWTFGVTSRAILFTRTLLFTLALRRASTNAFRSSSDICARAFRGDLGLVCRPARTVRISCSFSRSNRSIPLDFSARTSWLMRVHVTDWMLPWPGNTDFRYSYIGALDIGMNHA